MDSAAIATNVRHLSRLDLPGGGQIVVRGDRAYVGHMAPPHGTSILDVSDPRTPRVIGRIELPDDRSHSHKARVVGDLLFVNSERFRHYLLRKGDEIPAARARLEQRLGRDPSDAEIATELGVGPRHMPALYRAAERGYDDGGFKIYDVHDPAHPRLVHFEKTHGIGVHRFDVDERYAYVSTEVEGFRGNILVTYDISRPDKPTEVSRWWIPGQHVAGGETPDWPGEEHRLHHALRFGDRMYAACWQAGFSILDVSDVSKPETLGSYNYHPPVRDPTHTVMPVPREVCGRDIALVVDEEHQHHHGQPHAHLWVFDIEDPSAPRPLSRFYVSEADSPFSRARGRFGAHQFQEHVQGSRVYVTWFSGGLRIVDIADPELPTEVGAFVPHPGPGQVAPQSNDVDVDERGLVYLLDRLNGLDILEPTEG